MSRTLARFLPRTARGRHRLIFYTTIVSALALLGFWGMPMPGQSFRGPLPALTEHETQLATDLEHDVTALAGSIGDRNDQRPGTLARSAALVEQELTAAGYAPKRLSFDADGATAVNLEASLDGRSKPEEIVLVGAHYDTAAGAPGADDNASGVAAMLALARVFSREPQARTVRFVAFANEEPPHFWYPTMGSWVYAKACKSRGDRIVAMLSLESMGYFRDDPGSQKYPPLVRLAYPSTGNFIGFVGNFSSRGLVREAIEAFRGAATLPSEGVALPSAIPGVGWSDHWSFWQEGYDAIMVTDTAPFRNPNYHTPGDLPATLDYARLARVTEGLATVVRALSR